MVSIGIIGGGRVCAAHANGINALADTRLAGIAEPNEERRMAAAERHACSGCGDYRELLDDPQVDAVVIALPHQLHRDVTLDCLHAGKHVLLEKPMAMTVAECDEMIRARDEAGVRMMVGHSQHFFPVNMAARRIIQDGGIGELILATDTWYKPFWEGGKRPEWFLDDRQGGGMWSMNGSHMLDRLMFFAGSPVAAVNARIGNPVFGLSSDTATAFIRFQSGLCATLSHTGFREGVNRFQAELTGTEGQLKLDGDWGGGDHFWRAREGKWEEVPHPPVELALKAGAELPRIPNGQPMYHFILEMQEFARSIIEDREPSVSAEWGREIVSVMDACEESSRTGREVRM